MLSHPALVLFSGGQDSATCLAWALDRYDSVETLGFFYGQRHEVELVARQDVRREIAERFPEWGARLGEDHVLDLSALGTISDTALTRNAEIEMTAAGLPSTFVPGRNLIFFTFAAALAFRRGIRTLIGGMCQTDFSGYPDCRDAALRALEEAIRLGTDTDFVIETPLMWLTKAESWMLARTLGDDALIDLIVEHTHTCYRGSRETRHNWGYGCGDCPACELRAKGWKEWRVQRRPFSFWSLLRA